MNQPVKEEGGNKLNASRRRFLKIGLAGAGVAAAAAGGVAAIKRVEGIPHDEFPLPVRDDFRRIDQRNQINVFANSKVLNDKHPDRSGRSGPVVRFARSVGSE